MLAIETVKGYSFLHTLTSLRYDEGGLAKLDAESIQLARESLGEDGVKQRNGIVLHLVA